MRILIVGNEPYCIAGVPNYARAIAFEFLGLGHDVFFFFSGAWYKKYNWFITPYLRINRKHFPFEYAEIINSPNWSHNYGFPHLDISCPQIERLFQKYIQKIKPDIMHINSMTGLPASIIEIADRNKIKVFSTVHEYGLLCQKNVMIDYDGRPCAGPIDLQKCSRCNKLINLKKLKFIARLENTNINLPKFLSVIKRKYSREINGRKDFPPRSQNDQFLKLADALKSRLDYMVYLMNNHMALNICVSADVKETLLRFGVHKEKMLVQHIGSLRAKNQAREPHPLHHPLIIGNIGGVSYYKGQHVLLEAVRRLKTDSFILKIFGKYEPDYVNKITAGKEELPVEFLGKYQPEELPQILDQIDIMVLPSICNDTAPQTIFESYSARLPIIASNIGGFPDFIQDGVNGRLFKPGDSQDLAEKLDEILKDPDKIEYFAQNIPTLKTIKENAEELISLYEKSTVGNL